MSTNSTLFEGHKHPVRRRGGQWCELRPVLVLKDFIGVSVVAQRVKNLSSIREDVGLIPGLAQGVKGSGVPVAVVQVGSSSSSYWPPSLGTFICPKKTKTNKQTKSEKAFWSAEDGCGRSWL